LTLWRYKPREENTLHRLELGAPKPICYTLYIGNIIFIASCIAVGIIQCGLQDSHEFLHLHAFLIPNQERIWFIRKMKNW